MAVRREADGEGEPAERTGRARERSSAGTVSSVVLDCVEMLSRWGGG